MRLLIVVLTLFFCVPAFAQVPLKSGFYTTVMKGKYFVVDKESKDTLYLNPVPVCEKNDFADASVDYDNSGRICITISLYSKGSQKFAKATRENIGKRIAIIADNNLLSAPIVTSEIAGGRVTVSGDFTEEKAKDIVRGIKNLPPLDTVAFKNKSEQIKPVIVGMCKELDSALMKNDIGQLDKLLHENFHFIHSNGLDETKTDVLQHLEQGYLNYKTIIQDGTTEFRFNDRLDGVTIRRFLQVQGRVDGADFEIKLKVGEYWLNEKGTWILLHKWSDKVVESEGN